MRRWIEGGKDSLDHLGAGCFGEARFDGFARVAEGKARGALARDARLSAEVIPGSLIHAQFWRISAETN